MTQLNAPYPATAYLTGYLRRQGIDVAQADPAIELVGRLYSRDGIEAIAREIRARRRTKRAGVAAFLEQAPRYAETVDAALRFLRGGDPALALRIAGRDFLPEGPRFAAVQEEIDEDLDWAFGALGVQDRAKYLASLFVDDLADVIRDGVDARFALSRYGERLAASAPSFTPLARALGGKPTLVDRTLDAIVTDLMAAHRPGLVGITAPFPGNVYGAFRIAKRAKELDPDVRTVMGGGYVNTELRELSEPRVFDYFDYVTLDDGERPLATLIEHLEGKRETLFRTFVREGGHVVFKTDPTLHDVPQRDVGAPSYEGLPLALYVSVVEMLNPMHRLWSDGRWNKLTLAHGCYWRKCAFCDVTLDYIGRYEPAAADALVDRIVEIARQTGQSGFHFVDEAAPPALLRALAERLIERGVVISWWGNVRFDKAFTPELARLLARSGCVAVSGGLEAASDRLLELMKKGVTVEQVARVTRAFTDAGVMVHAYLMYGFPSQTEAEIVDSLERVRQLFEAGCIQSAFWHRFSVTAHSPVGRDPERFGIRLLEPRESAKRLARPFARNDLEYVDLNGCDGPTLDRLGLGLKRATYNFMRGAGLDREVGFWFEPEGAPGLRVAPFNARVPRDLIARALA